MTVTRGGGAKYPKNLRTSYMEAPLHEIDAGDPSATQIEHRLKLNAVVVAGETVIHCVYKVIKLLTFIGIVTLSSIHLIHSATVDVEDPLHSRIYHCYKCSLLMCCVSLSCLVNDTGHRWH